MHTFRHLSSVLKIHKTQEWILIVLMTIYIVFGFQTPTVIENIINTWVGKLVLISMILYAFMYMHPIIAVLSALVVFELFRRANSMMGIHSLETYIPSEEKKSAELSAFNQFPYTLEQEVVAKMAPIVRSGSTLIPASYKPVLETAHDAVKV